MAKRVRGSARPGQRRPNRRSRPAPNQSSAKPNALAPARTPADDGLTPDEEARAAELEATIVAEEAEMTPVGRGNGESTSRASVATRQRGATSASLSVRYAHEYDYVARDLREIFALMAILIVALFAIFFLVVFVLQA
jgi:hypothetical protein